jgi:hypothetical protein
VNELHRDADCPHRELAVGWALHILEPADESPVATSTAAETEEVGATLGLSVPQANPSTELEQRVLSVTDATREAPVVALRPSTGPPRHITRRFWLRAGNWLRPRR